MRLFGNSINKIGLLHVYSRMTIFTNFSTIFFNTRSRIKYCSCKILNKNIQKNILNDAKIIFVDYEEKGYYTTEEYSALSNIIFSKYCYSVFCVILNLKYFVKKISLQNFSKKISCKYTLKKVLICKSNVHITLFLCLKYASFIRILK